MHGVTKSQTKGFSYVDLVFKDFTNTLSHI